MSFRTSLAVLNGTKPLSINQNEAKNRRRCVVLLPLHNCGCQIRIIPFPETKHLTCRDCRDMTSALLRGITRNMSTGNNKIANLRFAYMDRKDALLEDNLPTKNPYSLFDLWFKEALEDPACYEPNAMCISTVSANGQPSSRYVLLKSYSAEDGLTFFTNYGSRKAQELEGNPKICSNFYWFPSKKQIRIEGSVTKVSAAESEAYFYERPRDSQIGATISPQSQKITGRHVLDESERQLRESLGEDGKVPMPNWGGYRITPHLFEFWQGQSNRIHDRLVFRRPAEEGEVAGEDGWVLERLAP